MYQLIITLPCWLGWTVTATVIIVVIIVTIIIITHNCIIIRSTRSNIICIHCLNHIIITIIIIILFVAILFLIHILICINICIIIIVIVVIHIIIVIIIIIIIIITFRCGSVIFILTCIIIIIVVTIILLPFCKIIHRIIHHLLFMLSAVLFNKSHIFFKSCLQWRWFMRIIHINTIIYTFNTHPYISKPIYAPRIRDIGWSVNIAKMVFIAPSITKNDDPILCFNCSRHFILV